MWYQKNASCPECRSKPSEKEAPPPPPRPSFSHHGIYSHNGMTNSAWVNAYSRSMTNHSERFMIALPPMTSGHTADLIEQANQIQQIVLSLGSQTANAPAATPEETMDRDVRLVSSQAGVPLDVARNVLEQCQGDIVTAIMEITMGPGSSVNVPDTFDLPELEG